MDNNHEADKSKSDSSPIAFKAETKQILEILIHSLYTEREVFLRELISNASDALTRVNFELLTNRQVLEPEVELAIRVIPNESEKTLTVEDTGIGMTEQELITNLGTIAQSGARDFIAAASEGDQDISTLIGQFGVGFYSAFMAAESITVTSRSYLEDAQAASWYSAGADTFTVKPAEKTTRGTSVTIKLKDDAAEFLQEARLREIIRKHSDFIPFPIYIGDEAEQVNRQTAIWRQQPNELKEEDYEEFYKQLTLDFEPPLAHAHMLVDAPVQMYAVLYVPSKTKPAFFSPRKEAGLKLYARKVLIQEFNRDLLPEYLGFIQGVVDSEDLPLNVSRETVQSTKIMRNLKKLVTAKVIDTLENLASCDAERYNDFWSAYGEFIKQGVAIETGDYEPLLPLLRFFSTSQTEELTSLSDYLQRQQPGQKDIYYIMGDDQRSVLHSPHLDVAKHFDYEVLLFTDPVDAFMLTHLKEYQDHPLTNIAAANLVLPADVEGEEGEQPAVDKSKQTKLIERFQSQLGERVSSVRMTERLSESPARLVDPEGGLNQEMQRVYRILEQDFQVPPKVLELNPHHPIIVSLSHLPDDDQRSELVIDLIYQDALLIEGLHPDPAGMITQIQKIMQAALD
jgi:molecular chaperone HtpG